MNRIVILILLVGVFFSLLGFFMFRLVRQSDAPNRDPGMTSPPGSPFGGSKPAERRPGAVPMDPAGRWLGFLLLVLFFGIVGYIFWPEYQPWLEKHGIVPRFEPSQKTTAPGPRDSKPPVQKQMTKPAATPEPTQTDRRKAPQKTRPKPFASGKSESVPVSIASAFDPFEGLSLGAWEPFTDPLFDARPEGIAKEPDYSGKNRRYGHLTLGTENNKIYYFVLDQIEDVHPVLYFDRNHNGDLSDDGSPLMNKGTGRFAAEIVLPIREVMPALKKDDSFKIWFFINEASWEKGFASHYSRTKLKGYLSIGGRKVLAVIAEHKVKDADFTNDGIYIDGNGDSKINPRTEYVPQGRAVRIDGKSYRFDVQW